MQTNIDSQAVRFKGVVKWFNKTYGFIRRDDKQEFFVHYSGIAGDEKFKILRENDNVEFEIQERQDGSGRTQAVNVKILPSREFPEPTALQEDLQNGKLE